MNSPWKLTDAEAKAAAKNHREMMKFRDDQPIRLSLQGVDARAQAEVVAMHLIDQYGAEVAEQLFAGAFRVAQVDDLQRMSLQPGTTKQIGGKTYVLNENHRWTLPDNSAGGGEDSAAYVEGVERQRREAVDAGQQIPFDAAVEDKLMEHRQNIRDQETKEKIAERDDVSSFHNPNVDQDEDGDGVTDSARVGVPAKQVPPPPKKIPKLPNLDERARKAETAFNSGFEADPEGMINDALELFKSESEPGGAVVFETDGAKRLSPYWCSPALSENLEERSKNRATLNTALHQTANAVTKAAFLKHLDTLPEGSEILVTCGGCGAGKGYALGKGKDGKPFVPAAYALKQRASAVWDSAGDQNATENPWILEEAEKRGLTVSFAFVHADPRFQWADPAFGVVKRATKPDNGRMVDAKVFADSYAIGAKNHWAFYQKNRKNPAAKFVFMQNGQPPKELDGMPKEALTIDRKKLAEYAAKVIKEHDSLPDHIREGALQGTKIWSD